MKEEKRLIHKQVIKTKTGEKRTVFIEITDPDSLQSSGALAYVIQEYGSMENAFEWVEETKKGEEFDNYIEFLNNLVWYEYDRNEYLKSKK